MPDNRHTTLAFDVTKVLRAYRHQACRMSVFLPLFNRITNYMVRNPAFAYSCVRKKWHARCVDFARVQCPGFGTWNDTTFAMNCPPFGVHTADKARRCGRALLCPFCFARQRVLYPFRRLEVALYGVSGPFMTGQELWEADRGKKVTQRAKALPVLRPDLKVVWFRRTIPVFKPGVVFDLRTLEEHVAHLKKFYLAPFQRRAEMGQFDAEFGFIGFELRPVPHRGRINLTRYGVLLVPADQSRDAMDSFIAFQPDLTRYDPHKVRCGEATGNKKGLYVGFSKAVRFPRWVFEDDVNWCTAMVRILRKFHATSNFGKVDGVVHYKKGDMPIEDPHEDHDNA